jgi:ribosomal protein S27AE
MALMGACPKCGSYMKSISERIGGVSLGKAAIGAIAAGPIGLAAGILGKKKVLYQCSKCGYIVEK